MASETFFIDLDINDQSENGIINFEGHEFTLIDSEEYINETPMSDVLHKSFIQHNSENVMEIETFYPGPSIEIVHTLNLDNEYCSFTNEDVEKIVPDHIEMVHIYVNYSSMLERCDFDVKLNYNFDRIYTDGVISCLIERMNGKLLCVYYNTYAYEDMLLKYHNEVSESVFGGRNMLIRLTF